MVNIAVIGCGYWGPNLARIFSQVDNIELHTCCDQDESKLKKMKSTYPYIKTSKDYQEVLNDPEVNAVALAIPAAHHYDLAKQALLAGKHVLLEKPITQNSQEAEELIKLAKEKNLILMVDHTFEYHPAIRKMKKIIESGELGEVYYITANWLNLGLLQPDVNVSFDLATHIFSIINYLTGLQPVSVKAVGEHYVRDKIEEMININVEYPNKIMAVVNVSWLEPCKVRRMTIVGSRKMLVFDLLNDAEQIKIYDKGVDINDEDNKVSYRSGDIYIPKIDTVELSRFNEPLAIMGEHFANCITEGKNPFLAERVD